MIYNRNWVVQVGIYQIQERGFSMSKCQLILIVVLLITACTPSDSHIQTAIAQTQVVLTQTQLVIAQTQTFESVRINPNTLTPSMTATRTFTRTPSLTPTRSLTLAPSLTDTLNAKTPSLRASPTFTMTRTYTPTFTLTPTTTNNPLTLPHEDGYYLVGIEISAGIWRNNSTDLHCNWQTTSRNGTIIYEYFGAGGGTADISPTSFAFQSKRCGTWTFQSNP
jgi:hypothetical protein